MENILDLAPAAHVQVLFSMAWLYIVLQNSIAFNNERVWQFRWSPSEPVKNRGVVLKLVAPCSYFNAPLHSRHGAVPVSTDNVGQLLTGERTTQVFCGGSNHRGATSKPG